MAVQLYTQGAMFVDGIPAAEAVSFTTEYDTQNQVVLTLAKGFAGITVGAGIVKVGIVEAIPRSGFEIDFYKRLKERKVVEFTGWRGGSQIHLTGFLMTMSEKHGVNQTSESNIDAICGEPDFS